MKRIFIVLGTSGAGKTYAVGGAFKSLGIPELVSHTTRKPRKEEIPGVSYHFINKEEYERLDKVEFTEYPPESGTFYCLSTNEVEEKLKLYDTVFAITNLDGVKQFREKYPEETKVIFVSIPADLMAERMRNRGDNEEDIRIRLETAEKSGELNNYIYADYVIENINLETTYERVKQILSHKEENLEIERKFLVKGISPVVLDGLNVPNKEIIQGYLGFEPEVRIRKEGDKSYITIKTGTGLVRKEIEKEISMTEFDFLRDDVQGEFIQKTRYYLLIGNHIAEINVYHGNLEGLISVEVEFLSQEEAQEFIPPTWFGQEVTNSKSYSNQQLAFFK